MFQFEYINKLIESNLKFSRTFFASKTRRMGQHHACKYTVVDSLYSLFLLSTIIFLDTVVTFQNLHYLPFSFLIFSRGQQTCQLR